MCSSLPYKEADSKSCNFVFCNFSAIIHVQSSCSWGPSLLLTFTHLSVPPHTLTDTQDKLGEGGNCKHLQLLVVCLVSSLHSSIWVRTNDNQVTTKEFKRNENHDSWTNLMIWYEFGHYLTTLNNKQGFGSSIMIFCSETS